MRSHNIITRPDWGQGFVLVLNRLQSPLCFPRGCVWSPGWGAEELWVPGPGNVQTGWCYNCPECGGWRWSVIKLWYQPSFTLTSLPSRPQTDRIPRVIFIRWSLKDTVFISTTGGKPNKIQDLEKRPRDPYKMGQFDLISDGWWLTALFLFRFVILCRSCSDLRLWNIKLQLSYSRLCHKSSTFLALGFSGVLLLRKVNVSY